MKRLSIFFLILLLIATPLSTLSAEGIQPDIRNYDVLADERMMPSKPCMDRTPEEWVKEHIGFNEFANDEMKFPDYLFGASRQTDRAATWLTPYAFKQNANNPTGEDGNETSTVGEICWYQPDLKPRIVGEGIIRSADTITNMFQMFRNGNLLLSLYFVLGHLPKTNGIYNTQKKALSPDPYKQSECPPSPEGFKQIARTDSGAGKNVFARDFLLGLACSIDNAKCQCKMTKMFIRTDSTIPYNTVSLCHQGGCTDEMVDVVDPQSQAKEEDKATKGWTNFIKPLPNFFKMVSDIAIALHGTITGKVPDQVTQNNVSTPKGDASYYTTDAHEVNLKFTNCKLLPFAKRSEHKECDTNWLAAMIGGIKNKLQGPSSQPQQSNAEPAEEATSSVVPAGL